MRLVVAVGGNAILDASESMKYKNQELCIQEAAGNLAELAEDHELVIVHGNGPQIGEMIRHQDMTSFSLPLDVLVAQTQGQIGSMLQRALDAEGCKTVCLVTQVIVDKTENAFESPSKPVGEYIDKSKAMEISEEVKEFSDGWRRVVPSPEPVEVVESEHIDYLLQTCDAVVAGGGGGVPITDAYQGVEAVIDKDKVASKLACELNADRLIILTDVPGVYEPGESDMIIDTMDFDAVLDRTEEGLFEKGTIKPKLEAAAMFVRETGNNAHIGSLSDPLDVVSGNATVIR